MIKSMTGFASVTRGNDEATVTVTVRALNHRHLDVQLRVPPELLELEARLRARVQARVARGRIEMTVALQLRENPTVEVDLNEGFVASVVAAIDAARARGLIAGQLTPGDLMRWPQALTVRERPGKSEPGFARVTEAVDAAIDQALTDLDQMRAREGAHLRADLDGRRVVVAHLLERIVVAAEEGRTTVAARLAERVRDLAADLQIDRTVIAQEIVRAAGRSDISEEAARLRAHLAHWVALADAPDACGRTLDFLLQEMNREVTTMGAKVDGVGAPEVIIAVRAEIEKMREQVQNVE